MSTAENRIDNAIARTESPGDTGARHGEVDAAGPASALARLRRDDPAESIEHWYFLQR